jgi:hypothetical protein
MEYKEFKKALEENNLTLKKFSELSGVKYGTCARWGKDKRPVSDWVESWLKLYSENKKSIPIKENEDISREEYQKLIQLKQIIKDIAS